MLGVSEDGSGRLLYPVASRKMTPAQVRRREAAIDQALRDLATGDYESIQMREIAERAGIALATLYRYFPSKEYLFAVALERWVDRIRAVVGAAARHGTASERLRSVLHQGVDLVAKVPNWFSVIVALASSRDPLARRSLQDATRTIHRMMTDAMFDVDDDDARMIASVMAAMLQQGWHAIYLEGSSLSDLHNEIDSTIEVIFRLPRSKTCS
jgi:AcrR family transcriptional regulator